jgi:hypothetical protein
LSGTVRIQIRSVGDYWIYHKTVIEENEEDIEKNPESKLWTVVKHCKVTEGAAYRQSARIKRGGVEEAGYTLMPSDVIKLGRVRFKVREIVSPAYAKLKKSDGPVHIVGEAGDHIDAKEEGIGSYKLDLS